MSKIKVNYYGFVFKTCLDNQEEECDITSGTTVKELLRSLVKRHGDDFRDFILHPDGQLKPGTLIHLNRRDIREMDGLDTAFKENDEIAITSLAM